VALSVGGGTAIGGQLIVGFMPARTLTSNRSREICAKQRESLLFEFLYLIDEACGAGHSVLRIAGWDRKVHFLYGRDRNELKGCASSRLKQLPCCGRQFEMPREIGRSEKISMWVNDSPCT
jgi:hypothetical protein